MSSSWFGNPLWGEMIIGASHVWSHVGFHVRDLRAHDPTNFKRY